MKMLNSCQDRDCSGIEIWNYLLFDLLQWEQGVSVIGISIVFQQSPKYSWLSHDLKYWTLVMNQQNSTSYFNHIYFSSKIFVQYYLPPISCFIHHSTGSGLSWKYTNLWSGEYSSWILVSTIIFTVPEFTSSTLR